MSTENNVSKHYLHGDLIGAIKAGLSKLGKTVDNVTLADLAPVDEFHIGGRLASDHFLGQLKFTKDMHVLDIGCGLGGAARFVAQTYGSKVSGIDLTREYIETGQELSNWLGLGEQICLQTENALSMSFDNEQFDGAYMMHVGMNIEDKARLFVEIIRVLKPGASIGVYDIMRDQDGELAYPVPWAAGTKTSHLSTPHVYRQCMENAGFTVSKETSRRNFALEFFRQMKAKTEASGGPSPLGLHTLMQESTAEKIQNMVKNITVGAIAPVELIAHKPVN